jgi:hypothetical protein
MLRGRWVNSRELTEWLERHCERTDWLAKGYRILSVSLRLFRAFSIHCTSTSEQRDRCWVVMTSTSTVSASKGCFLRTKTIFPIIFWALFEWIYDHHLE